MSAPPKIWIILPPQFSGLALGSLPASNQPAPTIWALEAVVQADGRREARQQSVADPAVQLLIIAPIVALGVDRERQAGAIGEAPGPGIDRAGVEDAGQHVESAGARLHAVEGPANIVASRRVQHGAAHIVIAAGREGHAEIDFDAVDVILIGAPDEGRLRIEQAVRAREAHAARDEIRRAIHGHEVGVLLPRAGENDERQIRHDAIGERQSLRFREHRHRNDRVGHRRVPVPAGEGRRGLLRGDVARPHHLMRVLAELRNDGDRQMTRIGHGVAEHRERHRRRFRSIQGLGHKRRQEGWEGEVFRESRAGGQRENQG